MNKSKQPRTSHKSYKRPWTRGYIRAELRDNALVRAIDLDTGRYASIDRMFELIEYLTRTSTSSRYQAARYHPLLARWLDSCAPPFPTVRYDAAIGYPTTLDYRGSPCFIGSQVRWEVLRFRPLP